MDKMSKGMAQELERFRVIPEEVPHVQRECRAASKSKCKGLLGSIDYRQCKIYEDKTRQTKQDSTGRECLPRLLRMSRMTLRDISRAQDTRMQNTRKIWRARQDGRNKTRQNRDPSLGCIECFGSAKLPKTMQDSSSAQQQLHGHNQLRQAGDTEKKKLGNAIERHDQTSLLHTS